MSKVNVAFSADEAPRLTSYPAQGRQRESTDAVALGAWSDTFVMSSTLVCDRSRPSTLLKMLSAVGLCKGDDEINFGGAR